MIALILQLWWVTNMAELRQTLAPQVQDRRMLRGYARTPAARSAVRAATAAMPPSASAATRALPTITPSANAPIAAACANASRAMELLLHKDIKYPFVSGTNAA